MPETPVNQRAALVAAKEFFTEFEYLWEFEDQFESMFLGAIRFQADYHPDPSETERIIHLYQSLKALVRGLKEATT